ncbi:VOC family protein [Actinokineospora inagensis]|uniref:VOC family protein n=1 Tax=Actinokineospora inagensis TaxID=103730 RepID=UPI000404E47D|nr:VOC family protein [Actinokineospora inagensis]
MSTPHDFQVVVDSSDPHTLADWWAETLGWAVEPTDEEFIRRMVTEGHARESDTTTHNGALVWKTGAAINHPTVKRRMLFQWVPEAKTVKNRVHVDVWVGRENVAAAVEGLIARGAVKLHDGDQGPFRWVTLADPQGNEFCVS